MHVKRWSILTLWCVHCRLCSFQASGSSELNYIEVEFGFKQPTGNYFIHGDDNRTPYADIDFFAKAEPLISSDEDDESIAGGDDNDDDFMTLEDVQQWNITVD